MQQTRLTSFKGATYFAFLIIFALVLVINLRTPLISDDYHFSVFQDKKLQSLDDVFAFLHYFYFNWSGRLLPTFFSLVSSFTDKWVFSVVNSIVLMILLVMVFTLARIGTERKIKAYQVFFAFSFIAYFSPAFGQDVFWMCGSYNYLWATTFLLFLIYPLRLRIYKKQKLNHSYLLALIALPLYFIGGYFNEGCGATLVVLITALVLVTYKKEKTIDLWMVLALVGAIAGFVLLATAPGNFGRVQMLVEIGQTEMPSFGRTVRMFVTVLGSYFSPKYLLYPILMLSFMLCLDKSHFVNSRLNYKNLLFWGFVVLISTFCFVVSPSYDERVRFTGTVIACVLVLSYLFNLQEETIARRFVVLLTLVCFSFVLNFGLEAVRETNRLYKSMSEIEKSVEAQRGESVIKVSACHFYVTPSSFVASYHLIGDKIANYNNDYQTYSVYKNVGTIKFVPCEK